MQVTWKRAHAELSRIAKARAALDHEEGRWLLVAFRQQVHARLGFGSFVEYVERVLGHSPRVTLERLRVAEALEQLPALDAALESNVVSWSAARELGRVATRALESVPIHVGMDDAALLRAALRAPSEKALRVGDARRPTWRRRGYRCPRRPPRRGPVAFAQFVVETTAAAGASAS